MFEVLPWYPKRMASVMRICGPVEQFSDLSENAFLQGESQSARNHLNDIDDDEGDVVLLG